MHFWKIGTALRLQPKSDRTAALAKLAGGKPTKLTGRLAKGAHYLKRRVGELGYSLSVDDRQRFRLRKVFS